MNENELRPAPRAAAPVVAEDERVAPELVAVIEDMVDHVARDPSSRNVVRSRSR